MDVRLKPTTSVIKMKNVYKAQLIAEHFLTLGELQGIYINPIKLQKLIYISHGLHLAFTGYPLLDEQVEAWDCGVTIPSIFKKYGTNPIMPHKISAIEGDIFVVKLLNKVWKMLSTVDNLVLSSSTMLPGSPYIVTKKLRLKRIDNNLIKNYFIKTYAL